MNEDKELLEGSWGSVHSGNRLSWCFSHFRCLEECWFGWSRTQSDLLVNPFWPHKLAVL